MIVSLTGASTTWFSVFLEGLLAAAFRARCLLVIDLRATPPARRTFNFTFFVVARLAADLRLTLVLALRRFEPFLRVAIFALAIALSYRVCSQTVSKRPTIIALSDSPQWRFGDFERAPCAKMARLRHRPDNGRSQAPAEVPRSRWRVRLKSPGPSRASRKNISRARPAAPICASASHDRAADGPGVTVTSGFSHLRAEPNTQNKSCG